MKPWRPQTHLTLLILHAGVKAYGSPAHGCEVSTVPAEERDGAEAVPFFVHGRWSVVTTLLSAEKGGAGLSMLILNNMVVNN